jgi:hypothetical protein
VFDEDSLTTVGTGSMSLYFNHHYTFGYFIYAAAVVAKYEPGWLVKWKSQLAYMVRAGARRIGRCLQHCSRLAQQHVPGQRTCGSGCRTGPPLCPALPCPDA